MPSMDVGVCVGGGGGGGLGVGGRELKCFRCGLNSTSPLPDRENTAYLGKQCATVHIH